MTDAYDLERFVHAQDMGAVWTQALAELRAGRKVSHWMWFVFPQLAGLGRSSMARRYAISSLPEAAAYLQHDLLGPRLVEAAEVTASWAGRSAEDIFGSIDATKLRSSMTLFAAAGPDQPVFSQVLDTFFAGQRDAMTETLLASQR